MLDFKRGIEEIKRKYEYNQQQKEIAYQAYLYEQELGAQRHEVQAAPTILFQTKWASLYF